MRYWVMTAALAVLATGFLLSYREAGEPRALEPDEPSAPPESPGLRAAGQAPPLIIPAPFAPAVVEAIPAADAPASPGARRAAEPAASGPVLTGVLLSLDRTPVEEEAVLVFEHDRSGSSRRSGEVVSSGGRFAFAKLPASAGRLLLRGTMSGLWIQAEEVSVKAGDRDVPVFLRRAGRIDGSVALDGSGLSHSEVQVRVVHLSGASATGEGVAWCEQTGVGRLGEFAFEGVPAGGVDIEVLHKYGHLLARVDGVAVVAGEPRKDPRLSGIPLPPVAMARIEVMDQDGLPLLSARMFIGSREVPRSCLDYDVEVRQDELIADARATPVRPGWFELPVPVSPVRARFLAPGCLPQEREIHSNEVVVLARTPPVVARLDALHATEPMAPGTQRIELEVSLQPVDETGSPLSGAWRFAGLMRLGDGRRHLEIPALGPGRYRLSARVIRRPEGGWG